jgi:hypothetical protein
MRAVMSEAANQPQYLTLEQWAEGRFVETPSLYTLRALARAGKFDPPAVKIGKAYYVEPHARVVDPNRRTTLVDRLKAA